MASFGHCIRSCEFRGSETLSSQGPHNRRRRNPCWSNTLSATWITAEDASASREPQSCGSISKRLLPARCRRSSRYAPGRSNNLQSRAIDEDQKAKCQLKSSSESSPKCRRRRMLLSKSPQSRISTKLSLAADPRVGRQEKLSLRFRNERYVPLILVAFPERQ